MTAPTVDRWSRRSVNAAALRVLRWLGAWVRDVLGTDAPETKALADAYRVFEKNKPPD